jgi:hypothetical protein
MNTTSKLAVVGLLLASTMGYAYAQTAEQTAPDTNQEEQMMADRGEGHGGRHYGRHGDHHGGKRGGRMMQIMDANSDGVIGEDEAAAMADHMFMRLDRNEDGSVDKTEFTTRGHRRGGVRGWFGFGSDEAAAVQKVREDKFAVLDADKNGMLTKVEFFAEAKAKLGAADADKDGKVSPWEFRAAN